ncbi:hypothetical protein BGZ58_007809 [Dissophora ornata]|nr:hypothetical protein BGZ58_007809 [Dissophora ornata]
MSQSSKPATSSYFKAAAKVLRLQKAPNRAKATKAKESSATSVTAPGTPTTPTFQHGNGRRLSYNQYVHHHHQLQQHYHHHQHYRPEHYDTPLCTLQRHRSTSGNIPPAMGQYSTVAANHKPMAKDVCVYSSTMPANSKLYRRSGPPSMFPAITIHHSQTPSTSPAYSTHTSLARSNSMPNRRWKRLSYQAASVHPTPQPDLWTTTPSMTPIPGQVPIHATPSSPCGSVTTSRVGVNPSPQADEHEGETGQSRVSNALTTQPHSRVQSNGLLAGTADKSDIATVLDHSTSEFTPDSSSTASQPEISRATAIFGYTRPWRSHTSSSNSSVFSTAMPLADSSMSIQSQLSESSMLSAAMTASGLPPMDVMRDQVDKSLAADSQALLVKNAHVGLAHVSFVDHQLIAEPCSAAIETWVN